VAISLCPFETTFASENRQGPGEICVRPFGLAIAFTLNQSTEPSLSVRLW
jgi:hypothetical protein